MKNLFIFDEERFLTTNTISSAKKVYISWPADPEKPEIRRFLEATDLADFNHCLLLSPQSYANILTTLSFNINNEQTFSFILAIEYPDAEDHIVLRGSKYLLALEGITKNNQQASFYVVLNEDSKQLKRDA